MTPLVLLLLGGAGVVVGAAMAAVLQHLGLPTGLTFFPAMVLGWVLMSIYQEKRGR